jgi:hypothetical protein
VLTNGTTSQANGTTSQANGTTSQANGTTSQANGTTSQANGTTSQAKRKQHQLEKYRAAKPMEDRLVAANIAIEKVLRAPELQARLDVYGYDRARMLQGQALCQQAMTLYQQQRAQAGEQQAATVARDTARSQAHALYIRHVTIARLALKDAANATTALDLRQRKRTQAGWLVQAQLFYANLLGNPALLAKMAEYGVAQAQLQAVQAQVATVGSKIVARSQSATSTREVTRTRDTALRALDQWMNSFLTMARVALADLPQQPDQLVILT